MSILEVNNLTKEFYQKKVLDKVSFSINENEIIGLVGKNGAGKTTLMTLIVGLIEKTSGEIILNGTSVKFGGYDTNKYVGYLPDVPEFYDFMTATEYLAFCGGIEGLTKNKTTKRIEEVMKLVGLELDSGKIKTFSRGMKQRLGIAQAMFHKPKLLVCDEPMSALDPTGRKEVLDILMEIKKETTILFSSHVLEDVERIASQVLLLHDGTIHDFNEIKALKQSQIQQKWQVEFQEADILKKVLSDQSYVILNENTAIVTSDQGDNFQKKLFENCLKNSIYPVRIEKYEESLDDLFAEVTK